MIGIQGFRTRDTEDSRQIFEKLSRLSLYYLMRANNIPNITDDMPKTRLVKIADLESDKLVDVRGEGEFAFKNVKAYKDFSGSIKIERPACTYEDYKEAEEKAEAKKRGRPFSTDKPLSVEDMTKKAE